MPDQKPLWPFVHSTQTVTQRVHSRTLSAANRVFAPGLHLFRDDWEPRNWIHLFNGNTTVLSVMFQQTQSKQLLPVTYIRALRDGRGRKKNKTLCTPWNAAIISDYQKINSHPVILSFSWCPLICYLWFRLRWRFARFGCRESEEASQVASAAW